MGPSDAAAWVAIAVTLGIAIVSWHRGNRADQHATQALELAEAAEDRARRLEAAQFERADVRWEIDWPTRHELRASNVGLDHAFDVELVIDPIEDTPGRRRIVPAERVAPTEHISTELGSLVAAGLSNARRARARRDQRSLVIEVRVRVTWRTESGQPGLQTWDRFRLADYFDPDD